MDPKNTQELDALFVTRAQSERSAAEAAEARRVSREAFLDRFYKARGEVMAPAMRAFGEYLRTKGLEFEVTTEDTKPSEDSRRSGPISASITLAFAPSGKLRTSAHGRDYPELRFTCNEAGEKVTVYESAMWGGSGSSGPGGDVALDQVTANYIEDRLTALVKKVLGR